MEKVFNSGIYDRTAVPVFYTHSSRCHNGYVEAQYLAPGDYVYDRHGQPREIASVWHERKGPRPVFHVSFNDGSFLLCGTDTHIPITYVPDLDKKGEKMLIAPQQLFSLLRQDQPPVTEETELKVKPPFNAALIAPMGGAVYREEPAGTTPGLQMPPYIFGVLYAHCANLRIPEEKDAAALVIEGCVTRDVILQVESGLGLDRGTHRTAADGRLDATDGHWRMMKRGVPFPTEDIACMQPELALPRTLAQASIPNAIFTANIQDRAYMLDGIFCETAGNKYQAHRDVSVATPKQAEQIKHLANSLGRFATIEVDEQARYLKSGSLLPCVVHLSVSEPPFNDVEGRRITDAFREYRDGLRLTAITLAGDEQDQVFQATHSHLLVDTSGTDSENTSYGEVDVNARPA